MAKNAVKTEVGTEVYTHDIFAYADEYVAEIRGGDDEGMADYFPDMIYYISDRIPKPSNDDIELLDTIFSLYTRLCARYRVLPTLECFSWLVSIDRNTFTDWMKGEYRSKLYYTEDGERITCINTWRINHKGEGYREVPSTTYSSTTKKWFNICKSAAVNRLSNKGGTDANLIFIAKAAYGMAETAPVQTQQARPVLSASELPKLGDTKQNDTIETIESRDVTENRIKEQ